MSNAPQTLLERELRASTLDVLRLPNGPECPLVRPAQLDELRALLEIAGTEDWRCLIVGSGSRLGWCPAPERVDVAISTEDLSGLVAFEPGDGTLTARAGTRMGDLRASVASEGYHLTPDVAAPERSTLGGVLGAGSSGFDRLRYGSLRHHVLGMQVMLADGSLAKTGGRLVKNVTGYDLQRLYCGSRGSLCVILEATLRLFPAPAAHSAVRLHCADAADAFRQAARVAETRIRPLAVIARPTREAVTSAASQHPATARWELLVFLAGREETIAGESRRLASAGIELQALPVEEEMEQRSLLRDFERPAADQRALEISAQPSRLAAALEVALLSMRERRVLPDVISSPLLASATLKLPASTSTEDLEALEDALARVDCTRRWRHVPRAFRPRNTLPEPARRLMDELRLALDPEGRFATGGAS